VAQGGVGNMTAEAEVSAVLVYLNLDLSDLGIFDLRLKHPSISKSSESRFNTIYP